MYLVVVLAALIAGCSGMRQAHEDCHGDLACQERVEAKKAALQPAPPAAPRPRGAQDPTVSPTVPLPRQPNTCTGRTDDNFPTTRCY
jgi:hypothetical protein